MGGMTSRAGGGREIDREREREREIVCVNDPSMLTRENIFEIHVFLWEIISGIAGCKEHFRATRSPS